MPMNALTEGWHALEVLVAQTLKVWWRNLPALIFYYTIGWLGYRLCLIAAATISGAAAWFSLLLVAAGFTCLLAGMILCLRTLGMDLKLPQRLRAEAGEAATEQNEESAQRSPMVNVLLMTLVPFLGLYSVFGGIEQASRSLEVFQFALHGMQLAGESILGALNPSTTTQYVVMTVAIVGTYLGARLAGALSEKLGRQWPNLVEVLLTALSMLIAIYGGGRVISRLTRWLRSRQVTGWIVDGATAVGHFFERFKIPLPDFVHQAWQAITDLIWPALSAGIVEPMLWLAMAGLAWGSQVSTFADLWESGRPAPLLQARGSGVTADFRGALLLIQEQGAAFVDEKLLPTWQSFKLVIKAGAPFTAAYIVAWALARASSRVINLMVVQVLGGQESQFWVGIDNLFDLVIGLSTELLKLALLAVTYASALGMIQVGRPAVVPAQQPPATTAEVSNVEA